MSATADLGDLRRAVGVTLGGYVLKALHPVLFVVLVRLYGAEAFGAFKAAEALVLLAARVALLGLDKGLLWWVARLAPGQRRTGLGATFATATLSAVGVTLLIAAGLAPSLARLIDQPAIEAPLRLMALGIVPLVWLELSLHALMGARRMGPQVLVRETVLPLGLVGSGLLLHPLGAVALPLSLVLSCTLGAGLALWLYRRHLGREQDGWAERLPPPTLRAYAWPMAGVEVANTVLLRLDIWAIAALGDLRLVGIHAAVLQFANAIRQVRRSFDPIVVAISSQLATRPDPERLAVGFSYATFLVLLTQLPILVVLIALAPELMGLFGPGFEAGAKAVIVLGGFWVLNGATSLAGVVVTGYGASRLTLGNTLVTIALLLVLLQVLVPALALVGAALAVGLAYSAQSLLQVLEMRAVTGAWNFRPIVLWPLALGLATGLPLVGWMLAAEPPPSWPARALGVALFGLVYGALALRAYRRASAAQG